MNLRDYVKNEGESLEGLTNCAQERNKFFNDFTYEKLTKANVFYTSN